MDSIDRRGLMYRSDRPWVSRCCGRGEPYRIVAEDEGRYRRGDRGADDGSLAEMRRALICPATAATRFSTQDNQDAGGGRVLTDPH